MYGWRLMVSALVVMALSPPLWAQSARERIEAAVAGEHRTPANRSRDAHRHPVETLSFFDLEPEQTVVELWPGGGWYTEILAPVVAGEGQLIAATFPRDVANEGIARMARAFADKLAASPDVYGEVESVPFMPPALACLGAAGSADRVLTFRNLHNWVASGALDAVFESAYAVLREGGVFGVVEHRAAPGTPVEQMKKSGYVTEDYAIGRAQAAGFRLVARSEVNANPRDTRDYPKGVWTLLPTLRLGDHDRARYEAIGESDRMTLRFEKPPGGPPAQDPCAGA